MQENISVTDSYSTGNAAQAMLEKLLQIYDVKTLVAQLNGVGENHWSAAILKRALANDSAWHRLSEKEFAHLQTLLPKPPEHHPHYAFRFIDLFAGIGGIVAVLNRLVDSACLPANGTNMLYALIKPTIIATRRRIILMKISATSPSVIKKA